MKFITFWFDPISPYAWLAFDQLPRALEGISHCVEYRPILFAGLLNHWGQKGPAEIEPKRIWTYRDVAWRAARQGTPLDLPQRHPFNPLPHLRLALACAAAGAWPSRHVVESVFRHVWQGGADANDPDRLLRLAQALAPVRDPQGEEVKAQLRTATEGATQAGVFGVPTLEVDGQQFWGADALPMLRAALTGDPWFASSAWVDACTPRDGVRRR